MHNMVLTHKQIGMVSNTSTTCFLETHKGVTSVRVPLFQPSCEPVAKDSYLYFFIEADCAYWKQILGSLLCKKGFYVLAPHQFINFSDADWLSYFITHNRLNVSFSQSLRYTSFASQIKEWLMTKYLGCQRIKMTIILPKKELTWQWVDLVLWWLGEFSITIDKEVDIVSKCGKVKITFAETFSFSLEDGEGCSVSFDGKDLEVVHHSNSHKLYLPKLDARSIELGCRCHEVSESKKWVIYSVNDTLFWLRNLNVFRTLLSI